MKIPNYDVKDDFSSNYKQIVSFMPDSSRGDGVTSASF